jgi:hypothetical protein
VSLTAFSIADASSIAGTKPFHSRQDRHIAPVFGDVDRSTVSMEERDLW